ncbi:hypothetical protein ACS0PU_003112 [Formica fusca]
MPNCLRYILYRSHPPWYECEKLVGSKDQGRSREKKKTIISKLANRL